MTDTTLSARIKRVLETADADTAELFRALLAANRGLAGPLRKAVNDYGKPGGPWNVPNEPGTWIEMARQALSQYAVECERDEHG